MSKIFNLISERKPDFPQYSGLVPKHEQKLTCHIKADDRGK